MMHFQDELVACGFTALEAKIYLALLQQNNVKAGQVAKTTGIKRSTTYATLDALIEKGVVSISSKDGIFLFHAEPPISITHYLEKKQKEIGERLESLAKIQTELELVSDPQFHLPHVSIFTGANGITTLLAKTLNEKEITMLIFGEYTKKGDPIPVYTAERIRKKMRAELITPHTEQAEKQAKKDKVSLRKTFFIPQKYSLPASVHISGDNVTLFTHSKDQPIGVLLQDKDIAQTFRSLHALVVEKIF